MQTILLCALALFPSFSLRAPVPDDSSGRAEAWREDLAYFVEEARRAHASPERPAHGAPFAEAVEELRRDIPTLSDDSVLCRFMALAALLDDGHTAIFGAAGHSTEGLAAGTDRRTLPLKFHLFPEGLFIVDGAGEWIQHAGSRVLRIGGVEAEQVLRRMRAYRGVDNEMTWSWLLPAFYLPRLLLLREVGAMEPGGDAVEIEVETYDRERVTLRVPGGEHAFPRKLRHFPFGGAEPLWLSRVDENFWTQSLPEDRALYVQFNQVRDAPGESLERFAGRLREELRTAEAETLIVDVRHNNGGNNTLLRPLVRTLIEFEMRAEDHRIYVLMGRNTFSAAQNFLNHTERWTDAVFVGEPSSSSPNFTGESNEIVLPNSGVAGSISNRYWQDSVPWDTRPWIEPDIRVPISVEAYFDGYDPVLERVLEHVRSR